MRSAEVRLGLERRSAHQEGAVGLGQRVVDLTQLPHQLLLLLALLPALGLQEAHEAREQALAPARRGTRA